MKHINTSKRGGKAAFYRLGFLHGFHGTGWLQSRRSTVAWPDWANAAYAFGHLDGTQQRQHSRCVHEPRPSAFTKGVPFCRYCSMKMRALRRRSP